jgi:hypothetical protein
LHILLLALVQVKSCSAAKRTTPHFNSRSARLHKAQTMKVECCQLSINSRLLCINTSLVPPKIAAFLHLLYFKVPIKKLCTKMTPRPRTSLIKDSFRKRKRTVFSKASSLASDFEAHVYIVVQFNGKFHVYNSVNEQQWPPSTEIIVGLLALTFEYRCQRAHFLRIGVILSQRYTDMLSTGTC